MHKRCTASACRAELPRHAVRCPKCGRATGRTLPPAPRAPRKPKPVQRVPQSDYAEQAALILRAVEYLRKMPSRQVRLGDDYFLAVLQGKYISGVKAIKDANDCGLKEAKTIADVLRKDIT